MTIHAHVENGSVVLDDPIELPEGAMLEVRVLESTEPKHPDTLYFAGIIPQEAGDEETYKEYLRKKYE